MGKQSAERAVRRAKTNYNEERKYFRQPFISVDLLLYYATPVARTPTMLRSFAKVETALSLNTSKRPIVRCLASNGTVQLDIQGVHLEVCVLEAC